MDVVEYESSGSDSEVRDALNRIIDKKRLDVPPTVFTSSSFCGHKLVIRDVFEALKNKKTYFGFDIKPKVAAVDMVLKK